MNTQNNQKIPYNDVIEALYQALFEYDFTSNELSFFIKGSHQYIHDIEAFLHRNQYCIPLNPQVKEILNTYASRDPHYKFLGKRKTHVIITVSNLEKDTITLKVNLARGFRNKVSDTNGHVLISPFSF